MVCFVKIVVNFSNMKILHDHAMYDDISHFFVCIMGVLICYIPFSSEFRV